MHPVNILNNVTGNSRFTLCEISGPGSGFYTESNYSRKQLKSLPIGVDKSTDIIATGQFHATGQWIVARFPVPGKNQTDRHPRAFVVFKNSRGK